MTQRLVFETAAINSAARFLADDPVGLSETLSAIDRLLDDPRPAGSPSFGSPNVRRPRVSLYCVLYRDEDAEISVIHIGRTGA